MPDGDRTMASDRGRAPGLEAADVDPGWLAGADALHLSGYSLLREPIAGAARHAAVARAGGRHAGVGRPRGRAADHDATGPRASAASSRELAPDVVFATVSEEEALGGPLAARDLGAQARARRLRGAARAASASRCRSCRAPVVDSTGAGDALAAGFLVGGDVAAAALRSGGWLPRLAASRCRGRDAS